MSAKKKRSPFEILMGGRFGRTVFGGVAAAGLATALTASAAEGQDAEMFGEAGVFVGYTWGAGGGVNWGLEGRFGADFRDQLACSAEPAFSTAGVARLSFVNLRPQLHVAGQAGVVHGMLSFMGGAGIGYRWKEDGGVSLPLGMQLQVHAGQTYFRADPLLSEISAGVGVLASPRDDSYVCAVPGRPLHDESGHCPLPSADRLDEANLPHDLDPELSDALAVEWERRARAEWASVPAFVQLADQLRITGAPAELVARAYRAAEDELRHAVATARASIVYDGAPVGLERVTPTTRAPARGDDALVRLAVESWVDGCLGEGKAAEAAGREARLAEDPALGEMQSMIAVDEASHAELAWDVLAWTVREGGDDVRHALSAVRDATPVEATGTRVERDLSSHGLLSESAHRRIGDELRGPATARLDAIVG